MSTAIAWLRGASPWDGRDRAPLRWAIAAVATWDLVHLLVLATRDAGDLLPVAPGWPYQWLVMHGEVLAALGGLGLAAALGFALGWAPLRLCAVLLVALHLAEESAGRAFRSLPPEPFQPGLFLYGWLLGLLYAREVGLGGDRQRSEALAESGALAACAASYVLAGFAKLAHHGLDWDHRAIWHVVLSLRPIDGWIDGALGLDLSTPVVGSRLLAAALAYGALISQLGAAALCFGGGVRRAAATLLVAMHVAMFVLAAAFDPEIIVLLAVFCRLWPGGRRGAAPAQRPSSMVAAGLATPPSRWLPRRLLLGCAGLVAVAWLSPLRAWMAFAPLLPRWPFDP